MSLWLDAQFSGNTPEAALQAILIVHLQTAMQMLQSGDELVEIFAP